ncbi:MAG: hypothetical protein ABIR39_10725 [Nocardioides sp.]|uniref:hypothetical protein n=1 Tax=Nocardioides sp. TaxID=35761 RepID=UPI0032647183
MSEQLTVLRKVYEFPYSHMLLDYVDVAQEASLGIRLENRSYDSGTVMIQVTIYAEAPELELDQAATWWPFPRGWTSVERLNPEVPEIFAALRDPRWTTHHARAFRLWCRSEGTQWSVEFSDQPLSADLDYHSFTRDDTDEVRGADEDPYSFHHAYNALDD